MPKQDQTQPTDEALEKKEKRFDKKLTNVFPSSFLGLAIFFFRLKPLSTPIKLKNSSTVKLAPIPISTDTF